MSVRFRVLGAVEIVVDGIAVAGTAPRHRAVLAYLLINSGQVLSADRIIDAMWGVEPPETARSQIHAAITALRRVLRPSGNAHLLETRAAGYVVLPDRLDLAEFTESVARAQASAAADPHTAAELLRSTLALWRGDALADVNADYVAGVRARLEEKRVGAIERLMELELALGRSDELLDELVTHAGAYPLRERLHTQLVLALHRVGRQADALAAARTFRETLAEHQGLDPSRAFLALEQAVRQDDPGLAWSGADRRPLAAPNHEIATERVVHPLVTLDDRSSATTSSDSATTRSELAHVAESSTPTTPLPNFLPYDIPDFAGREAELAQLSHPTDGPSTTIVVLDGMAGIGKTTLAIHTAHHLADRYPDGRLFVDLQGHTPGSEPVDPVVALENLLRQLGLPAERIPAGIADRRALWRAELGSRSVVVVLDNAADAEQLRPLLPGASRSLLLITSRRRLIDLDGAKAVSLDLLPAEDAVDLFGRIVGDRADAEPLAVLDVLQLCGFLPLAVRIAAARLHHRPRWTVEYLAGRLRDERRRLAELATADRGVTAAFTLSYAQLTADQQRMFRLLGLHRGRDIDAHAAAAVAGVADRDAEDLLEDLLDAHMLAQFIPGRYTFHALLREYARGLAADSGDDRHAAMSRMFEHYLHHARAAVDVLFGYGAAHRPPLPEPARPITPFADETAATAWLDAERENLVTAAAAPCDWSFPVCQLAATLRPYLDGNSRHTDAAILHNAALQASRKLGDRAEEGLALTDLGWTYWRQGDYGRAELLSQQAVELCAEIGADYAEARALNTLGNVAARRRDYDQAGAFFERALTLTRTTGNRIGEAHVLGNLGIVLDRRGLFTHAHEHLSLALLLHRELGNRRGEALVLNHIGLVHRRSGDHRRAAEHHGKAAELYRALGNRSDEAAAVNGLGESARAAGDPMRAIYDHRAALLLAGETGNEPERFRAHEGMARAYRALGDLAGARDHAEQALTGYRALEVPEAEDLRQFLRGLG
ncbi:AfsR/SARP family transcriptional regulator [Nocardia colli]|uniref:AfsR/SARP family transcriptional regulator n=1 Tax=Nocardia colli TaxID=2545717 RepID=UPI0035DF9809